MKKYAIIVAGGQGQRLGSEIPKQFLLINKRPVIFYSIENFLAVADEVIVVLPLSHFQYWDELCNKYQFDLKIKVVAGGVTRASSVMNGLAVLPEEGIVAIHDAVRPLVSTNLIEAVFNETQKSRSAVPVIPMRESLRVKALNKTQSINRDEYLVVQTPQGFMLSDIKNAYRQAAGAIFSDDAGVYEKAGMTIHHLEGETSNIKITFREDIAIAEAILKMRNTL